jgi:site-specific DNA-methyltransferase (adenine-specific)
LQNCFRITTKQSHRQRFNCRQPPAKIFKFDNRYSGKIHPTQKPIKLYEWLLLNYAKKGDKILDTHVGSASSLMACYNLGFDYVGFEIDKDYYEAASKRLADVKAQIRFDFALGAGI